MASRVPIIGAVAGLAVVWLLGCGEGSVREAAATEPLGRPALVATRALHLQAVDLTLSPRIAVLQALEQRDLGFEVSGRLVEIRETGDAVEQGGVLARLDARLEEAQLRQAELRVEEAARDLDRARGLRESAAASVKALESAETALALRRAEGDIAREQLSRRTMHAPFAGVVGEARYERGEVVPSGAVAVTLLDLSALRLDLGIPGSEVVDVRVDARVLVELPALDLGSPESGAPIEARVARIAPAPEEHRHLYEVEVHVAAGRQLRPGMTARARIVTRSVEASLLVPFELVVERRQESVVFFADGGVAHAVAIAGAPVQGASVLLSAELPYRELVVRGQRDLRDGIPLRVDNTVLSGIDRES